MYICRGDRDISVLARHSVEDLNASEFIEWLPLGVRVADAHSSRIELGTAFFLFLLALAAQRMRPGPVTCHV